MKLCGDKLKSAAVARAEDDTVDTTQGRTPGGSRDAREPVKKFQ